MKKYLALLLSAALALSLTACGPRASDPPASSDNQSAQDSQSTSQSQTQEEDSRPLVRLALLSGPTGLGGAKLMYDNDQGDTANAYEIQILTDNSQVGALLSSGEVDIAATATNVAAVLNNRNEGSIQMLAVNTLGVLYILEDGQSVYNLGDLRDKTLYATGQGANPEYILNYLLTQNGLTPGEDVDVQWLTAQEVAAKMLTEEGAVCMLPVPAATTVLSKKESVREALNLSTLWEETAGSPLPMGCIAARSDFVAEHPQVVADFLAEYEESVVYMADGENLTLSTDLNPARLAAAYGITENADIAAAALPRSNLTFVSGSAMRVMVQSYFDILCQASPDAIGGQMPYDDFYYQP